MTANPIRLQVSEDSEIARLLEAASEAPILLEIDGETFRLSKEKKRALSEEAYQAFRASAGGWADVDTERLKEMIYSSRQIQTRPPVDL